MAVLACFACGLQLPCPIGACRQHGSQHFAGGAACSAGTHRQVANADIQVQRCRVRRLQQRLCFLQPPEARHESARARSVPVSGLNCQPLP